MSPSYVGSTLTTVAGTAADSSGESGISTITYTLQYGANYWNGTAWQTTAVSPYAGGSCAGAAAGTSCVWSIGNIAWSDSQSYSLTVNAADKAGNTTSASESFIYDASAPQSAVTTGGGAMSTRLAALAGTVVDRISSYTASGLDGNLYVGVTRKSDNAWWDSVNSTWTAPNSVSVEHHRGGRGH